MGHLDVERKVSDVEELKFPPEYFEAHISKIPFGRDLVLLILKEGIQIALNTPKIDVIALPPKNYQPPGKYYIHRATLIICVFNSRLFWTVRAHTA